MTPLPHRLVIRHRDEVAVIRLRAAAGAGIIGGAVGGVEVVGAEPHRRFVHVDLDEAVDGEERGLAPHEVDRVGLRHPEALAADVQRVGRVTVDVGMEPLVLSGGSARVQAPETTVPPLGVQASAPMVACAPLLPSSPIVRPAVRRVAIAIV
jgi:hypothetical protein